MRDAGEEEAPGLKVTAFIPARGGSKGLRRKNVLPLHGVPLIQYAIRAARNSEYIGDIVVSTDDDEIAFASERAGAKIHWRRSSLSGDSATSEAVIRSWLTWLKIEEMPDIVAFLQCTAPLMLSKDIDRCINKLRLLKLDAVCACAPFHGFLWSPDNLPHGMRLPRQEGPYKWREAGSVYVFTSKAFEATQSRFGASCGVYEIPAERCLEIDSLLDLRLCEYVLKNRGFCANMEVEDGPFELGS